MLDLLRRLWYDREDYIRLAGDDILQRLKQQGAFDGLSPESFVSIDPLSREHVISDSIANVIAAGRQQWGHMDFYCAPINSPPEPRHQLSSARVQRQGERILHRLRAEGQLEEIAGGSFIAIEPQQGHFVVGDSFGDVCRKGAEAWGHSRMYVRPIEDVHLPRW